MKNGDIIQISPQSKIKAYHGCLAIVIGNTKDGCDALIMQPNHPTPVYSALHVSEGDAVVVGQAKWAPTLAAVSTEVAN